MSGGPIHDERGALIALAHAIEPGDARIGALIDTWGAERVCERLRAGQIGVREQSSMQVRLDRASRTRPRISALASCFGLVRSAVDGFGTVMRTSIRSRSGPEIRSA